MTDTSRRASSTPPAAVYEPAGGARAATGWTGWIVFAGVMLIMLGVFHIIEAVVALFREDFYLVGSSGLAGRPAHAAGGWGHPTLRRPARPAGPRPPAGGHA